MGKFVHQDVQDASLAVIATATRLSVCNAEPATVEDLTTMELAGVAVTAGDGNGDFTIQNGDISGRKVTVAQQNDMVIAASGTASHIALSTATKILAVTTCDEDSLTANEVNTVSTPAWDAEISDAV